MNFWKRLRLIGSLIVLCIAVLAIVLAVLRAPSAEDDTPSARPRPAMQQRPGTQGL
jgi:hypothetical protein